jgi:hypothetical protein
VRDLEQDIEGLKTGAKTAEEASTVKMLETAIKKAKVTLNDMVYS